MPPVGLVAGISAASIGSIVYAYEQQFMAFVTTQSALYYKALAGIYFLVLVVGITLVMADLWRGARRRILVARSEGFVPLSPGSMIPYLLSMKKYWRYFLVSSLVYGAFYSVITSMVVFQPTVDFAQAYGATYPSATITPCCGAPLFTPVITVYLVNHLGLLLIPLTVILLVTISILVGLNATMAAFAFASRARGTSRGWLGGLGAVVGLFTGCPTCAGVFFANLIGGSGAISLTTFLAYYQPVFILLSLPVLLVTPYLISRSLSKVFLRGCVVLSDAPAH